MKTASKMIKVPKKSLPAARNAQVPLALIQCIPQVLSIAEQAVTGYNQRAVIREAAHATVMTLAERRENAKVIVDALGAHGAELDDASKLALCEGLVTHLNAPFRQDG